MLNREEIRELILEKNLVSGYIDLESQLTPNGFDMTVCKIYKFEGAGALDFSNKERVLPDTPELMAVKNSSDDKYGWWNLSSGVYKVLTNEVVTLPNDLIATAFSRSSLLRMGAFTQNGVWDAGFSGRSEFVLNVGNPLGIKVKQNAKILQLIFSRINHTQEGYNGIYKNK